MDSLAAIHLADGYEAELVASEPLIQSPVAIDFGADGRLWVAEMFDYPTGLDNKGKPGGRIKVLSSSKDDGHFDKATLILDAVRMPTGIATWRDGVLVTAAPEIFFLRENGEKQVLFTGFKEANPQLRVNALRWGLDGWIYCASGLSGGNVTSIKTGQTLKIDGHDIRIHPHDGAIELVSGMSQYGRDRDDSGNWFGLDNSNPLFHLVLEDHYLRRNPDAPAITPKRQIVVPSNGPVFAVSSRKNEYDRTLASPGHPGHFTSACGLSIYRDDLLFPRQPGVEHAFTCEVVHNLIRHTLLKDDGISYTPTSQPAEGDHEFFASEDPWCHPVFTRTGPDGALWIVDMYRWMVEHPDWLPPGGPQRMAPRFRDGAELGRIYRVYPKGKRPALALPQLNGSDTPSLLAAMRSTNGWLRDKAQQMLIWQKPTDAIGPLAELARPDQNSLSIRIQALWTLHALGALDADILAAAARDSHAAIRREALRLIELRPQSEAARWIAVLSELTADPNAQVRLQLALTLGSFDSDQAAVALALLARGVMDDAQFAAAIASSAGPHFGLLVERIPPASRPITGPLHRDLVTIALAKADRPVLARLLEPIVKADAAPPGDRVIALADFAGLAASRGWSLKRLAQSPATDKTRDELSDRIDQAAGVFAIARGLIADSAAPVPQRVAAVTLLGHARETQGLAQLLTPQSPSEVQAAAVKAIARAGGDDVPDLLTRDWQAQSPSVRGAVIDVLVDHEPWALELLGRVRDGKIPVAQFEVGRRQRLLKNSSPRVKELAARVFGAAEASREKVVEQHRGALALSADTARGAKVFAQNCATCHKLGAIGNEIGPDLRSVAGWEPEALLVAILDPNRQVEPRYLSYTALTSGGETIFGIITTETPGSITIKGLDAREQTIPRSSLKSLEGSNRSLMPEGVEGAVSDQDLADVIRFLQTGGS
jgi:putative membrane-bound dehydrogenase-like protein